jgi:hypothetical protein
MEISGALKDQLIALAQDVILPILLIVGISAVVIWLAGGAVHAVVRALLDRETSEGTAQELSAVEVKKRMDTLEGLGATVVRLWPASASWASPWASGHRASSATTSPVR